MKSNLKVSAIWGEFHSDAEGFFEIFKSRWHDGYQRLDGDDVEASREINPLARGLCASCTDGSFTLDGGATRIS